MTTQTQTPAVDSTPVKALLDDVGERAKDAGEQAADGRSKLVAFNKANVAALKESAGVAGTGAKALGHEVVDNVKREFAAASDGPKSLSGLKSCLVSARDDTKAFGQHLGKVAGDAGKPLKNRVADVTAKPKAATVRLASPAVKSAKSKVRSLANDVEQLAD